MTVESTSRKQTFAGGQTALNFSFRTLVNHPEFVKANKTLISTGVDTPLVYNVDYTVSLSADGIGGTVTLSPSFSTAYSVTVYRSTDDLQESDYDDFNQFPADTVEDDFDRRTLISQERSDDLNRTAKLPISYTGSSLTLPNPQEGYSLVWSNGTLYNSNLTGSTGAIGPTGPTGPSGSSSLQIKVGVFTRDLTATASTQSISGLLFAPKGVIFISATNGVDYRFSVGIADATTGRGIDQFGNNTIEASGTIVSLGSGTAIQQGTLASLDSSGFTINWTKTGSPSAGTGTISYIAFG